MSKVKDIAFHPASVLAIIGTLVSGGGIGVYKGVPYINKTLTGLSSRMDVMIYLMCDNDKKCVENAWEKVIAEKIALDARHGDH